MPTGTNKAPPHQPMAKLPLAISLLIMVSVTIYPRLLAFNDKADHLAALLIMWAMSAGFVVGLGFVPQHPLIRWSLSGWAQLFALLAFLARAAFAIANG
ncbi:MAG: cyd operon YbgE family protein [Rugosibacter sp.]